MAKNPMMTMDKALDGNFQGTFVDKKAGKAAPKASAKKTPAKKTPAKKMPAKKRKAKKAAC